MNTRWGFSHGKDGFNVHLYHEPNWLSTVERLGEFASKITFHLFCCHVPEWTFHIPLGKRKKDEDDLYSRSLGSVIYRIGNALAMPFAQKRELVKSIPVDEGFVREHAPDFHTECKEIFAED